MLNTTSLRKRLFASAHARRIAAAPVRPPALARVIEHLEDRTTPSRTWYVNDDALGANTGLSWVNAYASLQSALTAAVPGDEIWVAAGTYKPTTGTDRAVSFNLKSGVGVYGGFAGSETASGQRNWTANVTVLSGEIGSAGNGDNSYHVVQASGGVGTAVLDGFTITGGNANGGACTKIGAAGCSPPPVRRRWRTSPCPVTPPSTAAGCTPCPARRP